MKGENELRALDRRKAKAREAAEINGPLETLFNLAKSHGLQSEPDMEIGDLQAIAMACWAKLDAKARREVYEAQHADLEVWS